MSEKFYEICVKCQRTFTDKNAYEAHKKVHSVSKTPAAKPIDAIKKQIESTPAKNAAEESAKAAAVSEVNMMKKLLAAAGIEAQTMTAEQVKIRYTEEKAKGNVK